MSRYRVQICVAGTFGATVSAQSEEEARDVASEKLERYLRTATHNRSPLVLEEYDGVPTIDEVTP